MKNKMYNENELGKKINRTQSESISLSWEQIHGQLILKILCTDDERPTFSPNAGTVEQTDRNALYVIGTCTAKRSDRLQDYSTQRYTD